MARLAGKVALISGAARGIGAAIARAFHQEGAHVVLTDIRDELGQTVAAEIGTRAEFHHLDVRLDADWQRVVEHVVQRHGGLDILVNNAGITGFDGPPVAQDPEHAELDAWRAVHATNLDGVFLGCKHAIRVMRRAGTGSIINMGSRSGVVEFLDGTGLLIGIDGLVPFWLTETGRLPPVAVGVDTNGDMGIVTAGADQGGIRIEADGVLVLLGLACQR